MPADATTPTTATLVKSRCARSAVRCAPTARGISATSAVACATAATTDSATTASPIVRVAAAAFARGALPMEIAKHVESPTTRRLALEPRRLRRPSRRPTLRFTPYAWAKLVFLRDLGPAEVGGFGISADDDLLLIEHAQTNLVGVD